MPIANEEVEAPTPAAETTIDPPENVIAIDEGYERDSAYGGDDFSSETTSLASTLLRGHVENGRRYASLRDDYWGPSDEQQFETMDAGHVVYLLLESHEANPLFRSPIDDPANILDIGTASGTWAIDAADKFPSATVHGVDIHPPPSLWVPPNAILEVEDVNDEWTWKKSFDLIHMRLMLGAFTDSEWTNLYEKCYQNIKPGGWIEQLELDCRVMSDDGTLPPDSLIAGWGDNFEGCADRAGRSLATQRTMKAKIEAAGFVNVQEKLYKVPIGRWPRDKVLKETGRINQEHWSSGLEGWAMWLLTRHGAPQPWSADEVRVYVARVRQELERGGMHIWHYTRRVWAQRPVEDGDAPAAEA